MKAGVLVAVALVVAAVLTPALSPPRPPDDVQLVAATSCDSGTPTQPAEQDDHAGLFDVAGQVKDAINGWFTDLATSALNPVLAVLGCTVLATPDLTGQPRVQDLWGQVAVIANTVYVLFVLAGGVLVMAHESLQAQHSLKEIGPRLVLGIVAGNSSLVFTGMAIEAANALSGAFTGMGVSPAAVWGTLAKIAMGPHIGATWWIGGLVMSVLAIAVLVTYLVRLTITLLLVVAAPIMLACHAHPVTDPVAQLWWRAFGGVLAIQVAQALTLIVAARVFFDPAGMNSLGLPNTGGLVDLALAACLLWILIKIPSWITRLVLRGGGRSRSRVVSMVKGIVLYKALAALTGGAGAAAGAAAGRRGPGAGGRGGRPGSRRPGGPTRPGGRGGAGGAGGGPGSPGTSGGPGPQGSPGGRGPRGNAPSSGPRPAAGSTPPRVPRQHRPADDTSSGVRRPVRRAAPSRPSRPSTPPRPAQPRRPARKPSVPRPRTPGRSGGAQ